MHPLTYNFTYRVDSTTLAGGDYELIPEQGVESAEDPGNAVEDLTEAPYQSSENFCGRTNLNYTDSSTRVLAGGLPRTSNGIIPLVCRVTSR
jgi:hypothetical protein